MALSDFTPLIVAVVGTGGVVTAIVAFIKVRPEAGQIAVTASEGALVVQSGVIKDLRDENAHLRTRLEDIESKVALLGSLRERVDALEEKNKQLRADNEKLRKRIYSLETQVRALGHEPVKNGE